MDLILTYDKDQWAGRHDLDSQGPGHDGPHDQHDAESPGEPAHVGHSRHVPEGRLADL